MATGVLVGDPHAKRNNSEEISMLTDKLVDLIKEKELKFAVIMGDLAHDHAIMHLQAWQSIVNMMTKLAEVTKVFYIVGNHDMLNNTQFHTQNHFFEIFKQIKNITVIDKATAIGKLLFVPYVPNGRFNEAVQIGLKDCGMDLSAIGAVLCHQEFKGAKMGAIESKDGDEWDKNNPPVISGHIHDRQQLGNVRYIGAPYQTSFGDTQDKFVELMDIDNDGTIKLESYDLEMPKKITKNLTCEEFKKFKPEDGISYRVNIIDTTENITKAKRTKHYKTLLTQLKIVMKPTDKIQVKKLKSTKQGFRKILGDMIDKESEYVQEEYKEVSGK